MFIPRSVRYARAAFDYLIRGFATSTSVQFASTTLLRLSEENDFVNLRKPSIASLST